MAEHKSQLNINPDNKRREGGSISRFLKKVGREISRITPLPMHRNTIPPDVFIEEREQRTIKKETLDELSRLVNEIKRETLFRNYNLSELMKKIEELFDEKYGAYDTYNQRCAVAIIAVAQTLVQSNELNKLKILKAEKYLKWVLTDMDGFDGIQTSAISYLQLLKAWTIIGEVAQASGPETHGKKLAQQTILEELQTR